MQDELMDVGGNGNQWEDKNMKLIVIKDVWDEIQQCFFTCDTYFSETIRCSATKNAYRE